jgi:hypothetical protein
MMTRRQPLCFTALLIAVLFTGANAFVPANYRNPSFSLVQKKVVVFPGNQKQPNVDALSFSTERQSTSASTTSLQMVAPTGAALAAITGAMTGGLFAGGLHAMSGKFKLVLWKGASTSFCYVLLCCVIWRGYEGQTLKLLLLYGYLWKG